MATKNETSKTAIFNALNNLQGSASIKQLLRDHKKLIVTLIARGVSKTEIHKALTATGVNISYQHLVSIINEMIEEEKAGIADQE